MSGAIYKAIPAIMKEVGAIGKGQKNDTQNFMYRGVDDVYNELHKLLSKHEVFTVSEILDRESSERPARSGGILMYEKYTIRYTFFASDGSSVTSTVVGIGMDSGDKAGNKAQAVAHKYALLQIFCVPTAEKKDPDGDSPQVGQDKKYTRAQKFATRFEDVAKQTNLPKKEYNNCRRAFVMRALKIDAKDSTKAVPDSSWDKMDEIMKKYPKSIDTFIGAYMKGDQNGVSK